MPCRECMETTHTVAKCPYLKLRAEKIFQKAVELTTPLWGSPTRLIANKAIFGQFNLKDLVLLKKRLIDDVNRYTVHDHYQFQLYGHKNSLCMCLAMLFNTMHYIVSDDERDQLQSNPHYDHAIVEPYVFSLHKFRPTRGPPIRRKEPIRLCFKNEEFTAPKEDCPICMNKITAKNVCKLNCGHMMCHKCVIQCAQRTNNNPVCCLCRATTVELTIPHKPLYYRLDNKYCSIVGIA